MTKKGNLKKKPKVRSKKQHKKNQFKYKFKYKFKSKFNKFRRIKGRGRGRGKSRFNFNSKYNKIKSKKIKKKKRSRSFIALLLRKRLKKFTRVSNNQRSNDGKLAKTLLQPNFPNARKKMTFTPEEIALMKKHGPMTQLTYVSRILNRQRNKLKRFLSHAHNLTIKEKKILKKKFLSSINFRRYGIISAISFLSRSVSLPKRLKKAYLKLRRLRFKLFHKFGSRMSRKHWLSKLPIFEHVWFTSFSERTILTKSQLYSCVSTFAKYWRFNYWSSFLKSNPRVLNENFSQKQNLFYNKSTLAITSSLFFFTSRYRALFSKIKNTRSKKFRFFSSKLSLFSPKNSFLKRRFQARLLQFFPYFPKPIIESSKTRRRPRKYKYTLKQLHFRYQRLRQNLRRRKRKILSSVFTAPLVFFFRKFRKNFFFHKSQSAVFIKKTYNHIFTQVFKQLKKKLQLKLLRRFLPYFNLNYHNYSKKFFKSSSDVDSLAPLLFFSSTTQLFESKRLLQFRTATSMPLIQTLNNQTISKTTLSTLTNFLKSSKVSSSNFALNFRLWQQKKV